MARKKQDKDAESVWQKPEMAKLDAFTRDILKVPKRELDKKLTDERKSKGK